MHSNLERHIFGIMLTAKNSGRGWHSHFSVKDLGLARTPQTCPDQSQAFTKRPIEFWGNKQKATKPLLRGGAHGGCFQEFVNLSKQIAQGGGRKQTDLDAGLFFYIFSTFLQQASSFARSTAVCFATLRRHLFLHLNPSHIISADTQLDFACRLFLCPA